MTGRTVYIVDGSADFREATRAWLMGAGFDVTAWGDAGEAIDQLAAGVRAAVEQLARRRRIQADDAEFLLPSHGPVFRRDNRIVQSAIDRLTRYQYMADFGTCAIGWPLLDEWEADVCAGRMPDFKR